MKNILSFDVEEWFHIHNLWHSKKKNGFTSRVEACVNEIFGCLKRKDTKATFFVLGEVAEAHPEPIKKIIDCGHEVASHGWGHKIIQEQTPQYFKEDLQKSLKLLKGITGREVLGYRAPGYSITKDTLWALDIIKECGLKYDSSIYPVSLRWFTKGGIKGFSRAPFDLGGLIEFPLPTLEFFNQCLPVATSAYLRIFPYSLNAWAIKALNKNGIAATVNFHSWEFDPDPPKAKFRLPYNIKYSFNLSKTKEILNRMLDDFEFTTAEQKLRTFYKTSGQ